jgi:hypothetical protein
MNGTVVGKSLKGGHEIQVKDDKGVTRTVDCKGAAVTINGAAKKLLDLEVGDVLTYDAENDPVTKITATRP